MSNSQFLTACSAEAIQKAAEQLMAGHLVAFPTETVYGLGADAANEEAVKKIYRVKGRPENHPLIVHISTMNALHLWALDIPDYAIDLAYAFWPGPMTLILKRKDIAKDFITGSQDSVGIRVPSDPVALQLLARFEALGGKGVAAPSANRFGHVSPTSPNDVVDEIGSYLSPGDLILNGEQSDVGIESTIIDCRNLNPEILRPGAITIAMINSVTKVDLIDSQKSELRVSGGLEKHYAPNTTVIINEVPKPGQAFMALAHVQTPKDVYRISAPKSVNEFARIMYRVMRKADDLGFNTLVIQVPDGQGIEVALLDRLSKAAKGR
jgi:L-threonylcarbamoyladenylate synthase